MKKIIFLSVLCFSAYSQDQYDSFLNQTEMHSFSEFSEIVEKRKDKLCTVLNKKYKEHKNDSFLNRRIVYFYSKSNCDQKITVMKESLASRDPILVIGALNIILDNKSSDNFNSEIEVINNRFKTDVTIQKLLANIRKSRNKEL
jgi:hypothetical protein